MVSSPAKNNHNATYRPDATNRSSNSGCSTGGGNGRLTVTARRLEDGADMPVNVGVPGGGGSGCPAATVPVRTALAQAEGVSIIPVLGEEAVEVDCVEVETAVGTLADRANEACVEVFRHDHHQRQNRMKHTHTHNASQDMWNGVTAREKESNLKNARVSPAYRGGQRWKRMGPPHGR
jgi:hypothetical protein